MSWNKDKNAQFQSRILPNICNFNIWRQRDVLYHKTHSLVAHRFIFINLYAHVYPPPVHGNQKSVWVYSSFNLNIFTCEPYTISLRIDNFSRVTHINFATCMNVICCQKFWTSSVQSLALFLPLTLSYAPRWLFVRTACTLKGKEARYQTAFGASFSILSSSGTGVPGTTWDHHDGNVDNHITFGQEDRVLSCSALQP